MNTVKIEIKQLPHAQGLPLPQYQTSSAAGMDLAAAVDAAGILLGPGEMAKVPTGLAIALPEGYEAQVRPRSGLAAKYAIGLVNSPGTIDADYRGEIQVLLINWGKAPFLVERGMRIAQMVIAPVVQAELLPVDVLGESERGTGGFGSTGLA